MEQTTTEHRYEPDYAIAPGETLAELLETRNMSQAELARRAGLSAKHVNLILKGTAGISSDTALKLEHVLQVPARIWNALEANYQGHQSRLAESRELQEHLGWASKELIRELTKRNLVKATREPVQQLREVLRFFGVASIPAWESMWGETAALGAYRLAKQEGDPVALAAWMRIGELEAADVDTAPFDRDALRRLLPEMRKLTTTDLHEWLPRVKEMCRSVGIVLLIERELPKARVNGVARWLSPKKALIQLSARYLREDILWFTFFHEVGHLLLHAKRNGPRDVPPTFIDTKDSGGRVEDEANAFARDLLIPPPHAAGIAEIHTLAEVQALADELGISPGIVVGRIHHEGHKGPAWGAGLIARYKW